LITQSIAKHLRCKRRTLGSLSEEQKENLAKGPSLADFISEDVPTDFNPYKRIKGKRLVLKFQLFYQYSTPIIAKCIILAIHVELSFCD
jgi:hypothetical protein